MSESVPSRAVRGLGNALSLTGEKSAPPGIELELPAQSVYDLTQLVRYGSAPVFQHLSDGWLTANMLGTLSDSGFSSVSIADWSSIVSGSFGISLNSLSRMALWIYSCRVQAKPAIALVDVGDAVVTVQVPGGVSSGGAGLIEHVIFSSVDGVIGGQTALLEIDLLNNLVAQQWPVQWAAGQALTARVENVNANSITWTVVMRCRMLPLGVPPLP